jgi:hypothetical protein
MPAQARPLAEGPQGTVADLIVGTERTTGPKRRRTDDQLQESLVPCSETGCIGVRTRRSLASACSTDSSSARPGALRFESLDLLSFAFIPATGHARAWEQVLPHYFIKTMQLECQECKADRAQSSQAEKTAWAPRLVQGVKMCFHEETYGKGAVFLCCELRGVLQKRGGVGLCLQLGRVAHHLSRPRSDARLVYR